MTTPPSSGQTRHSRRSFSGTRKVRVADGQQQKDVLGVKRIRFSVAWNLRVPAVASSGVFLVLSILQERRVQFDFINKASVEIRGLIPHTKSSSKAITLTKPGCPAPVAETFTPVPVLHPGGCRSCRSLLFKPKFWFHLAAPAATLTFEGEN